MRNNFFKATPTLLTLCLLLQLGACASSFTVTGATPSPLVPKLALRGKINYTDAFKRYNYAEKDKARAIKNVDFGEAQTLMFESIFSQILHLVEADSEQIDLRIEPELLDFQYSVPRETKLKLYEIWLKYRVKITDADNQGIADWVVKGYGKTPTAMLTSATKAFNAATNVALRDIGAQLAIGFPKQAAIEEFIKKKSRGGSLTVQKNADENARKEELEGN